MRHRPYPRYKSSGVDWLGDVPAHWEVKRLKYTASINDEALPETTKPDLEIAYVDISSVDPSAGIVAVQEMTFEDAPSRARRAVRDGDTVVSTVRTYLRAIAPIQAPRENLVVSTGFAVIRPRTIEPNFLSFAVREASFVETVVARSVGVSYPAVNASEIGTIPIPVPSVMEQRAIASFLDAETAKLERLVEKKREVIEKLKEKRTALISRTVTRGLPPEAARAAGFDPHPKLTPSGIEWLGDVPNHWKMLRFRRVINGLYQGWSPNASAYPAAPGEPGVMKLSAVSKGRFIPEENKALEGEDAIIAESMTPHDGDLLISRSNTPDLVGDACVVRHAYPLLIIPDLLYRVVIDRRKASANYVCWFLLSRAGRAQIEADARGSSGSMVKLGQGHLRSWLLLLPPLVEQSAIASYLDGETEKIDQMIAKVETAIARLREYRTALITATVTGKIDVREAVSGSAEATLPESGDPLRECFV